MIEPLTHDGIHYQVQYFLNILEEIYFYTRLGEISYPPSNIFIGYITYEGKFGCSVIFQCRDSPHTTRRGYCSNKHYMQQINKAKRGTVTLIWSYIIKNHIFWKPFRCFQIERHQKNSNSDCMDHKIWKLKFMQHQESLIIDITLKIEN